MGLPRPPAGWQFLVQDLRPRRPLPIAYGSVAALGLLVVIGALTRGFSGALLLPGVAVALVGLLALLRPRWFRALGRSGARVMASVGVITVIAGIILAPAPVVATPIAVAPASSPSPAPTSALPSPTPQATPTGSPREVATASAAQPSPTAPPSTSKPSPAPAARSALALVASLAVKGRAPKTGYSRDQFGSGWLTTGGCNSRERVLRRDISEVVVLAGTSGCTVVGGRFDDPYLGQTLKISPALISTVDIDHVVALSDAWQKGAQQWSSAQRVAFANDQLELLATGQSLNSAKGDGDTATWLPPNRTYRCAYVARQVTIKAKYQLWVTNAEKNAMTRILATCPRQPAVTAATARKVKDPTATFSQRASTPKASSRPQQPSDPSGGGGTDPRFGSCREAKAAGYGPYTRGRDAEYGWYQDRDQDGVVCEG